MTIFRVATLAVLVCGALTSCVASDDATIPTSPVHLDDNDIDSCLPQCEDPVNDGSGSTTVTNVVISGREVFDDWRDYGRFNLRQYSNGVSGHHHELDNVVTNYLGLLDATVEVYEVDRSASASETDCYTTKSLGTATVAADGRWSLNVGTITDNCTSDDDPAGRVQLAVKTKLTFCSDTRCFKVVDVRTATANADMTVWSLWHPNASSSTPLSAASNANLVLSSMVFRDTTTSWDDDEREKAAWAFAAMVDSTRRFHKENGWPFFYAEQGPVYVRYPGDDGGHTLGPGSFELGTSDMAGGWTPLHEYGHVLNARLIASWADVGVWGPEDKQPCGVTACDSWGRGGEYEYASKAWKEGFADFAGHIALDNVGTGGAAPVDRMIGCSIPSYDTNATAFPDGSYDSAGRTWIFDCTEPNCASTGYPTNVARALCDWYDAINDDDASRSGGGDTTSESLASMFDTILEAYQDVGVTNLETPNYGFGVCDLARSHVQTSPSSLTTDQSLLLNNGITCNNL